jgi:hypothetical protein
LLVTGAALLGLAALAEIAFPVRGALQSTRPLLVWGPAIAGIGLTPALTLMTRRPLAGVVFAIAIPGLILVACGFFFPLIDGPEALAIVWFGTLAASAIGLLALLHVFPRFEIVEEGGASGRRSRMVAAAAATRLPTTRRHWAWALLLKELRLQRMTMAISALHLVTSIGVLVAQQDPLRAGRTFGTLSLLHGIVIAIVAGSVAGAEERHLGTLAIDILQPVAAWRKWLIKAGTALGLAWVLAYGLPQAIMLVFPPADPYWFEIGGEFVVGVLLLATAALYVSSLSSNTIWALLSSIPAIGGAALFGARALDALIRSVSLKWAAVWSVDLVTPAMKANVQDPGWQRLREAMTFVSTAERVALTVLTAAMAALVLHLAGRNQRSFERTAGAIVGQAAVLAAAAALAAFVYVAWSRIAWTMAVP